MAAATSCSRGASAAARLNASISGLQAQHISPQLRPGSSMSGGNEGRLLASP